MQNASSIIIDIVIINWSANYFHWKLFVHFDRNLHTMTQTPSLSIYSLLTFTIDKNMTLNYCKYKILIEKLVCKPFSL